MEKINNFFLRKNSKYFINYFYSFFFGSLIILAFPPFNFWPLIFPSLTYLFLQSYHSNSSRESFLNGWFFGLSFFAFGLYWIFNSFVVRSDFFIYLIPFFLIGLSCFLSIFIGLVSFLNFKFKDTLIISIIFFSIFWTSLEMIRGLILTGFPWNLISHTIVEFTNIIQITSIIGAYGLSFILIVFVLSFSIFFIKRFFFSKEEYYFFSTIFLIFIFIIIFGEIRLKNSSLNFDNSNIFRIVQPNILQKDKLNSSFREKNLKKLLDLSFRNKMGALNESEKLIILWPETAIYNLQYVASLPFLKKKIKSLKKNEYIISGSFRKNKSKNLYFNSIVILNNDGTAEFLYDKHHLVPFGEYIPFTKYINNLGINFNNLEKGKKIKNNVIEYKNVPRFTPLICYELIFPGKYISDDANLIINFTNDAWFGNTTGPYQHFIHSIFRAIEEGNQVIRVANTGISGSIGPYGRVLEKIDLNKSASLDIKYITNNPDTFYSKYGNKFVIIILISFFSILYFLRLKIKKK